MKLLLIADLVSACWFICFVFLNYAALTSNHQIQLPFYFIP